MATFSISKISGVLLAAVGSANPKTYINTPCSYQFSDDNLSVTIYLGDDVRQVLVTDLRVNGQTPANATVAKVLMNSVIGT